MSTRAERDKRREEREQRRKGKKYEARNVGAGGVSTRNNNARKQPVGAETPDYNVHLDGISLSRALCSAYPATG